MWVAVHLDTRLWTLNPGSQERQLNGALRDCLERQRHRQAQGLAEEEEQKRPEETQRDPYAHVEVRGALEVQRHRGLSQDVDRDELEATGDVERHEGVDIGEARLDDRELARVQAENETTQAKIRKEHGSALGEHVLVQ